MLFGVFSGVILVLMALVVFLGVMKGRRYAWEYAAVRLANVIISLVVAIIAASMIGKTLGGLIGDVILNVMSEDLASAFESMPSVVGLLGALVAMITAPIVYYFVFSLIRGIIAIFAPTIAYALKKGISKDSPDGEGKSKKKKLKNHKGGPIGMILGGLCALVMFVAIAAPVTAYFNILNGAMMIAGSGADNPLSEVVDVADAVTDNAGVKTVRVLGGDLIVSGMTSYKIDGKSSNLLKETKIVSAIGEAVYAVGDTECDRPKAANEIREVANAFDKNVFIPNAMAEFLDGAASSWSKGEEFAGIEAPSLGDDMDGVASEIYGTFEGSTEETVKGDIRTIVNIIAYMVETDVLNEVEDDFALVLEKEDITKNILLEILNNDHLDGIIGEIMDFGVNALCETLEIRENMDGIYDEFLEDLDDIYAGSDASNEEAIANAEKEYKTLFDDYALKVDENIPKEAAIADASGEDMVAWLAAKQIVSSEVDFVEKCLYVTSSDINLKDHKITNTEAEAEKLAKALHTVLTLTDKLEDTSDTVNTVMQLGPVLDAFAATETVGADCTGKLLVAILQSDTVSKSVGFNHIQATDIADSINSGAAKGGYVAQMKTLAQTVDVLQVVANKGDSKEAVQTLLKDLTPETAKTMQTVTTPSVMKENGVPEKSAESASSMMSDMLGGLSDAKAEGMTDEQLDKETAAVNNVLNTAMNIDSSHDTVFGEESATGVTAEQYVNDLMDSQVVSETIINHVYGEGDTPTMDPLNSERTLSESETGDLVTALNNKWQGATAEEKADPNFNKSLVAMAALVNVSVTITDQGVVAA